MALGTQGPCSSSLAAVRCSLRRLRCSLQPSTPSRLSAGRRPSPTSRANSLDPLSPHLPSKHRSAPRRRNPQRRINSHRRKPALTPKWDLLLGAGVPLCCQEPIRGNLTCDDYSEPRGFLTVDGPSPPCCPAREQGAMPPRFPVRWILWCSPSIHLPMACFHSW